MAGLWELDHAQFSRALEHLTDPSLTPTFTDEILLTLIQHPKCDPALATAYYIATFPPLADQKTLEAYFELLKRNSVVEAYNFAQRQDYADTDYCLKNWLFRCYRENLTMLVPKERRCLLGCR